ncbi:MAG: hypothetical protein IKL13_00645 [Clostridia bacterium]|nr:hypothetical protein [Clostridia bacterium]
MPENNGKYNIDDLVNSLLKERQPEISTAVPVVENVETDEPGNPNIIEIEEEFVSEVEDEMDEGPSQLLDFGELEAVASIMEPSPIKQPEEIPTVAEGSPMTAEETPAVKEAIPPIEPLKKRKKLFGRKLEDTASLAKNWVDYGLKPIGHYRNATAQSVAAAPEQTAPETAVVAAEAIPDEPTATPARRSVDEFPAVKAAAETITMQVVLPSGVALPRSDEHTRVVPTVMPKDEIAEATAPTAKPMPILSMEEQLPDQLSLEEMVRVEDIEPAEGEVAETEDEMDPEERLQRTREEKVRAFTLDGDEEEENEPEEEPVAEEEPEIEDFTGYQDTQVVEAELKYRCRSTLWSLLISGVVEFALLILTLLTVIVEQSPISPMGYLLAHLFGLLLMMGLNYATITRGLSGLFTLCANNDTAPALASAVCLVNVIGHLFHAATPLPFWTPLAGLLLVFSAVAHHKQEVCVRRNFAFVSYPGDKYAAAVIEEEGALQEIGRRAVSDGEAKVAYFRRTGFLSDYLSNAYDTDGGDDWSRWLTPAALGLSLLMSLLALLSEHVTGVWDWLRVFTGMVCVSMPVTLLAVQTPLSASCRRMLARGGFLNGWKAVRCFGQPDALAVDIADLYPDESMLLHGIKMFSGTHIDEAILTAASLAVRAGGPLSMIFRRIIENKDDLLYEVDSLVYEQGMGLSGWVDGRRVFVGNGRLLQNHGVDVPSADYEARYAKDGRRLVYLSIAGQLSAMFVVSYLPDPEIQAALQDLCRSRVTLLVRSCDPNITASDLCESFELDEYYVDVLPAAAGRMYMQLTEKSTDNLPAVMASNGHILGTARALSACRGLQAKVVIALAVQTVFAVLGLIFCLLWTMNGTLSLFQPLLVMLASLFFSWFIPLFRRA